MATIAEIKKQYPQYANIPDKELADALYQKYYSNTSKGDFYKAVGYNESWKEALGRGVENLQKESENPVQAVKNLGLGILKGGSDIIDGGAQLLARGAAGVSGAVAPGSSVDQFLQNELKKTEAYNQDREDRYQSATNGSVLAGVGRVGGNAAIPLGVLGGASKVTQAATLPSKMAAGARVGALGGALQPVYDMDQPGASYVGPKALQIGGGAVIGAGAPVVSRVAREAASATGKVVDNPLARMAENSLVNERGRALFGNSVNPAADAQIIKDLATLKQDPLRFQQVAGGQAAVGRSNATGIGSDYRDEVINLMKQAGMNDTTILNILNKSQITSADIASLPNTPAGKAAANALTLAVRSDAMTKPVPSNTLLSPVRTLVEEVLPKRFANPINAALGGRATGENVINKLTTPRSVAAAENVLAKEGSPAAAIDDLGSYIKNVMNEDLADQMYKGRTQAAADRAMNEAVFKKTGIPGGGANEAIFTKNPRLANMPKEQYIDELQLIASDPSLPTQMRMDATKLMNGENTDMTTRSFENIQNLLAARLEKGQFGKGILNQTAEPGVLYQGSNVSVRSPSPASNAIFNLSDEQVRKLIGRSADTMGDTIESQRGYLTTRASRALKTFTESPDKLPEADKALLKELGLI